MDASDTDRLRAFLLRWPEGSHLTTRAVQVMAGLQSLDDALHATGQLSAEGLLEMERIGATRLWYPRVTLGAAGDRSAVPQAVLEHDSVPALVSRH